MNTYLCIDIGTNSIRVLEKDSSGKISRWGKLERPAKPFHASVSPMEEKDVVEHLGILLAKMNVIPRAAVAYIPAFLTFTVIAESADPNQIPAAPGTFKIDAVSVAPNKFFLTAVPNDVIEKYGRILGEVGFESASWESKSVILAKNFSNSADPILIIDLDERSTNFIVAQNGKPVFSEHTDFALASDAPDVIISKVKKNSAEKNIKKIRWITKDHFLIF